LNPCDNAGGSFFANSVAGGPDDPRWLWTLPRESDTMGIDSERTGWRMRGAWALLGRVGLLAAAVGAVAWILQAIDDYPWGEADDVRAVIRDHELIA
jgi:hypothetical protein